MTSDTQDGMSSLVIVLSLCSLLILPFVILRGWRRRRGKTRKGRRTGEEQGKGERRGEGK